MMISIIMPVFNGTSTINRCIKSIISAKKELDIELIIIDDGSKDNTVHLIQQWLEENPWIIMHQQKNNGAGSARNKGLDIATGDYIVFIDSDDTIDNWYFDFVIKKAVVRNIDMLVFGHKRIELDGTVIEKKNNTAEYSMEDLVDLQLRVTENSSIFLLGCTRIFSRHCIGNSRFDPDIKLGVDSIFNLSCINNARHLSVVSDCPYNYYANPCSITSSQYKPNLLDSVEAHYKARIKAHKWPVNPIKKQVLLSDISRNYLESMLPYLLNNLRYIPIQNRRAELVKIRKSFVYENCIPNYLEQHSSRGIRLLITSFSHRWYAVTLGLLQISWLKNRKLN